MRAKRFVKTRLIREQLRKHGRIVVTTQWAGDSLIRVHLAKVPPWEPDPTTPSAAPIAA